MASSTSKKLGLYDLVEDVLILILAECDIAGIITISKTCKYLHRLALSNNVWFPLVTNLVQRRFIDSRPEGDYLKNLTTVQLISLVERLLCGPKLKTWADSDTDSPESRLRRTMNLLKKFVRRFVHKPAKKPHSAPVESRRIVLHPKITTGPGILHWENKAKLLPGGKYVLFQNWSRLGCYNVFEDRLVWEHTPSMDRATVLEFEAELVEDDRAVVLTCQRTWSHPRKNFVEISTLDIMSGVSTLDIVCRVPNSDIDNPFLGCAVCGDIVAVYLRRKVLLINWQTSSRIVIKGGAHIALVPDHLVLALRDSRGEHQLAVSPFASLTSWTPVDMDEPSIFIMAANVPIRAADTIALMAPPAYTRDQSLWAFENPQRGSFKIWLHTVVNSTQILYSYEYLVGHDHDAGVSWRFLSSIPMPGRIHPSGMSLSGHTLGWRSGLMGLDILPPDPPGNKDTGRRRTLEFPGRSDYVHLSPFSGALTYSTRKELVIVYHR